MGERARGMRRRSPRAMSAWPAARRHGSPLAALRVVTVGEHLPEGSGAGQGGVGQRRGGMGAHRIPQTPAQAEQGAPWVPPCSRRGRAAHHSFWCVPSASTCATVYTSGRSPSGAGAGRRAGGGDGVGTGGARQAAAGHQQRCAAHASGMPGMQCCPRLPGLPGPARTLDQGAVARLAVARHALLLKPVADRLALIAG